MITAVLFAALASAVVVGIWKFLVGFVKECLDYITKKVKQLVEAIFVGMKCFVIMKGRKFIEIVRGYVKQIRGWKIEERETELDNDEALERIPPDILAKAEAMMGREADITHEVELQLENCA